MNNVRNTTKTKKEREMEKKVYEDLQFASHNLLMPPFGKQPNEVF